MKHFLIKVKLSRKVMERDFVYKILCHRGKNYFGQSSRPVDIKDSEESGS